MKISNNCLNLIKKFEGYHDELPNGNCTAYLDPVGIPTIGYGTTIYSNGIKVKIGDILTKQQAEQELLHHVKKYSDYVKKVVKVPLNQNQFDALISFVYNIGTGAFSNSTLLKKLNAKDYKGAGNEILRWTKGNGGVTLAGLVRRRQAEFNLFNSK
jgi:GH24 family phage-related lysozyme (muramidase)